MLYDIVHSHNGLPSGLWHARQEESGPEYFGQFTTLSEQEGLAQKLHFAGRDEVFQLQFVLVEFNGVLDLQLQDSSQLSGSYVIGHSAKDGDQVILSTASLDEFFSRPNE